MVRRKKFELDDFNGLGTTINEGMTVSYAYQPKNPISADQLAANQAATKAAFALAQAKVDLDTAKVVALQNKATTPQEMLIALPGYNAGVVPYVAPTPAIIAAQAKVDALTVQAAQTAAVTQGLTPAQTAAAVTAAQVAAAQAKAAQLAKEKAAAAANAVYVKNQTSAQAAKANASLIKTTTLTYKTPLTPLNWWDQMWADFVKFLASLGVK